MIDTQRPWLVGTLLPTAQQAAPLTGTGVLVLGTHTPAVAADVAAFAVLGAPPPRGAPV